MGVQTLLVSYFRDIYFSSFHNLLLTLKNGENCKIRRSPTYSSLSVCLKNRDVYSKAYICSYLHKVRYSFIPLHITLTYLLTTDGRRRECIYFTDKNENLNLSKPKCTLFYENKKK